MKSDPCSGHRIGFYDLDPQLFVPPSLPEPLVSGLFASEVALVACHNP